MPAELQSYLDTATGLPLPIAPVEFARLPGPGGHSNWHHHYHPAKSPILQTPAGVAVRNCRIQFVPRDVHQRYHDLFAGPPLPGSNEEAFRTTVLAVAGVVPRS